MSESPIQAENIPGIPTEDLLMESILLVWLIKYENQLRRDSISEYGKEFFGMEFSLHYLKDINVIKHEGGMTYHWLALLRSYAIIEEAHIRIYPHASKQQDQEYEFHLPDDLNDEKKFNDFCRKIDIDEDSNRSSIHGDIKINETNANAFLSEYLNYWQSDIRDCCVSNFLLSELQIKKVEETIRSLAKKFSIKRLIISDPSTEDEKIDFGATMIFLEQNGYIKILDINGYRKDHKVTFTVEVKNKFFERRTKKDIQLIYQSSKEKIYVGKKDNKGKKIKSGLGKTILDKWFFERNGKKYLSIDEIPGFTDEKYRSMINNWSSAWGMDKDELEKIIKFSDISGKKFILISGQLEHKT